MQHFHLADRPCVAEAIKAAAACSDLDQLGRAIEAYKGHDLAARSPYVPSQRTDIANPLMIITEKPETAKDLAEGRPFSGDYGAVMREALTRAGVDQKDLHIAYALHWTPEGETSPNKTQLSASRPFLFREIELVKPRALLVQGRAVLEAMSMYRGHITDVLGQTMSWRHGDAALQMYVTWHPAFALRFITQIPEFQQQVAGFFDRFGKPTVPYTEDSTMWRLAA